jgi:hypothetical protein
MFHRNQADVLASSHVNRGGSALLDEVRGAVHSSRILGEGASPDGIAHALLHGPEGLEVDAIGVYTPGIDDVSNFDLNESLGSSEPRARKVTSTGVPRIIHVVMDAPERTRMLEGERTYEDLGNFALAVATRIADVIGDTDLAVYHTDAPTGVLFEGNPADAEQVFRNLRRFKGKSEPKELGELLKVASRNVEDENDATVVVSDFMDGFDADSGNFSWESALRNLAQRQQDLLRINRFISPTHSRIPFGLVEGLDLMTVANINSAYSDQLKTKNARLESIFGNLLAKTVKIDMADPKSRKSIIKSLIGNSAE